MRSFICSTTSLSLRPRQYHTIVSTAVLYALDWELKNQTMLLTYTYMRIKFINTLHNFIYSLLFIYNFWFCNFIKFREQFMSL